MQVAIGFLLAFAIGLLSWKIGALSVSGAVAATVTGGVIFGFGGFPWAALLLTFFISSSLLSRLFQNKKEKINEKFSKGSKRDWGQVMANGALGALFALFHYFFPNSTWLWIAFCGAMAAVNADTWATEMGVLSPAQPRLITNGKIVESGTSGGISLWGSFSALLGSLVISIIALLFPSELPNNFSKYTLLLLSITIGGLLGAFVDSLLGATIQAIYYCPTCLKETERHPVHSCGSPTTLIRGLKWLNNDLVNFSCSLAGAMLTILFAILLW